MRITLEVNNSRIYEAEEQISELEDRMVEITALEQNKKNEKKLWQFKTHLVQHPAAWKL